MAGIKSIRDAYFLEGKSITQIGQECGCDRKTIRKYILKEDWNEQLMNEIKKRNSVLDPFKSVIDTWLEEDRRNRKKQRHTAKRVYKRLVEEYEAKGFSCSYRTVASYVSFRKKGMHLDTRSFIPLEHKHGEAQGDFGEADFIEHGKSYCGYYLSLSFPVSNAGFLQLFKGSDFECFAEGMINIFTHIKGVPLRIWFDNASIFVSRILKEGNRNLTERFFRFQEHFGFQPVFCNPGAGNEKGHVENKIGYHRRNLLVPVPEFDNLESFNSHLLNLCDKDNHREHYRKEKLIDELFIEDCLKLLPLPKIQFDGGKYVSVQTDAYGKFTLNKGKHRYSTSPKYAKSNVRVRISAYKVEVYDESMREIVTHNRLFGNQQQEQMDWLPYLSQLARRPSALKYTPVYDMMPDVLQKWIDSQPRSSVSGALSLVSRLSKKSSFSSACMAISQSIDMGVTDCDSLLALHEKMTRYSPLEIKTSSKQEYPKNLKIHFNPQAYDSLLHRSGGNV